MSGDWEVVAALARGRGVTKFEPKPKPPKPERTNALRLRTKLRAGITSEDDWEAPRG